MHNNYYVLSSLIKQSLILRCLYRSVVHMYVRVCSVVHMYVRVCVTTCIYRVCVTVVHVCVPVYMYV